MNYTRTNVPAVDQLLDQADRETDTATRAALLNEADRQLAVNAVTAIPLFQKPTQLGYRDTLGRRGRQPDGRRLHLEHRGVEAPGLTPCHRGGISGIGGIAAATPEIASPVRPYDDCATQFRVLTR